jgi:DNA-binding transcriptional LysR family regulator
MPQTDFNDLMWFLAVAEDGNFTRAAAGLGVVQSTLSHRIKRLETRMGMRLLARTTRSVSTTEAEERLRRTLAPRVAEIEEEIAALMVLRDKPAGSVRITLSHHSLTQLIWPKLRPVLRDYPEIRLELCVDAGFRDIVEDGFDAGIRLGESVEHEMIALRVGPDWRLVAVASPAYLVACGQPEHPQDAAGPRLHQPAAGDGGRALSLGIREERERVASARRRTADAQRRRHDDRRSLGRLGDRLCSRRHGGRPSGKRCAGAVAR